MKKISHKYLEACRTSPKAWAMSQTSGGGFATFGYRQALNNAICVFHRSGNLKAAESKLEELIERNFTNSKRSDAIRGELTDYAKWFSKAGIIIADSNVTLNYPTKGFWHLGGIIARVDITPNGYRAVLFEAFDNSWKSQLRMPLIQLAIAEQFGRPPAEVRVGLHDLDGNATTDGAFSSSQRQAALTEFLGIGTVVQSILPPT
jgi:hypothetical protein